MKHIIKTLELAEELLDGSAKREISEIERDIILEKLRKLYSSILALEAEKVCAEEVAAPLGVEALVEEEEPVVEEVAEEIADEVVEEETPTEEPEEELVVEPEEVSVIEESIAEPESEVEEEPIVNPEPIAEPEPEIAEVVVVANEPTTAAEEAMLSLYDDDDEDDDVVVEEQPAEEPTEEPTEEPEIEVEPVEEPIEEPIEEPVEAVVSEEDVVEELPVEENPEPAEEKKEPVTPTILGEVLVEEQTRLGDTFASRVAEADVATTAAAVSSLRQSITLNDKYILMRDLFAGDNEYYNSVISELDSFESLEEAMLYIYDNHHWNPNSEGVLLLMDLLSRKLF